MWDVDGNRYLDLVGGIAVNALGHGHPALVSAVSKQAAEAIHVSNLFTSPAQVELAERLIEVAGAPEGSSVFFANPVPRPSRRHSSCPGGPGARASLPRRAPSTAEPRAPWR